MQRLIAVLRRPQGIFGLVSDRVRAFDPKLAHFTDPYRESVVPLASVPESVCPWRDKDVKAWRALSAVPALSRRAGVAIVRAVIGSVADPTGAPGWLPPLSASFGARGGAVDLRPYLCSAAHEQDLLEALGGTLTQVSADTSFPEWHWTHRLAIAELPLAFRRRFLWGLHLSPWSQLELTLGVYEALDLEHEDMLSRGLARLLSFCERPIGIAWCHVIGDVAPPERARACELILESGAYQRQPTADAREALVALG
jgi:hypothetical protein